MDSDLLRRRIYDDFHRKLDRYWSVPRWGTKYQTLLLLYRMVDSYLTELVGDTGCGPGCFYCCHLVPRVVPVEVFAIAEWVSAVLPRREIEEYYLAFKEQAPVPGAIWRACPFLKEGRCGIYEYRPLVSRCHYAKSVEDCKMADGKPILTYQPSQIVREAAVAWLKDGLPGQFKEEVPFIPALQVALRPLAFDRWKMGEPVFEELVKAAPGS